MWPNSQRCHLPHIWCCQYHRYVRTVQGSCSCYVHVLCMYPSFHFTEFVNVEIQMSTRTETDILWSYKHISCLSSPCYYSEVLYVRACVLQSSVAGKKTQLRLAWLDWLSEWLKDWKSTFFNQKNLLHRWTQKKTNRRAKGQDLKILENKDPYPTPNPATAQIWHFCPRARVPSRASQRSASALDRKRANWA